MFSKLLAMFRRKKKPSEEKLEHWSGQPLGTTPRNDHKVVTIGNRRTYHAPPTPVPPINHIRPTPPPAASAPVSNDALIVALIMQDSIAQEQSRSHHADSVDSTRINSCVQEHTPTYHSPAYNTPSHTPSGSDSYDSSSSSDGGGGGGSCD